MEEVLGHGTPGIQAAPVPLEEVEVENVPVLALVLEDAVAKVEPDEVVAVLALVDVDVPWTKVVRPEEVPPVEAIPRPEVPELED